MKIAFKKVVIAITALSAMASVYAATGYLKGEQVSGMNKICYYDVMGSTHSINVASYELCPVTYNF